MLTGANHHVSREGGTNSLSRGNSLSDLSLRELVALKLGSQRFKAKPKDRTLALGVRPCVPGYLCRPVRR